MLLEQQAENVFTCRVGRLRPGSTCTTTITYLTLLDQEGRSNRFTLPITIAPKYNPPGHLPPALSQNLFWQPPPPAPKLHVHTGYGCDSCLSTPIIGPRFRCTQCPDFDLCDPCHKIANHHHPMVKITDPLAFPHTDTSTPHMPTLPMPTMPSKLEDLTIRLYIRMPSPILSIQCPSHPANTHIQQHTGTSAMAFFHSESACSLSSDFIILVEQEACFDPRVLCELDPANRTAAVSLTFIPRPLDMVSASQLQCELVFLIDCSGSMYGHSVACVRECMQLLLHSLPVNSLFNIIRFGDTWSSLFSSSRPYNDETLRVATRHVAVLQANLGGTQMYAPLQYALSNELHPTHPQQVFLLTDAQVSNVDELVHLVSQHATNTRLFTFGIGEAADRSLCKRLAIAGRGKSEFVTVGDSLQGDLRGKVMRQVARAMQPALTGVKVDWKNLNPHGDNQLNDISKELKGMSMNEQTPASPECAAPFSPSSFVQCPSVAPTIFLNSRYVLHALNVHISDMVWEQAAAGQLPTSLQEEIDISARANHPHESGHVHKKVILTCQQLTQATVIHTLAARARIRELEQLMVSVSNSYVKEEVEGEILHLSLKYSLTSSMASFVAVYGDGDVKVDVSFDEMNSGPSSLFSTSMAPTFSFPLSFGFGSSFASAQTFSHLNLAPELQTSITFGQPGTLSSAQTFGGAPTFGCANPGYSPASPVTPIFGCTNLSYSPTGPFYPTASPSYSPTVTSLGFSRTSPSYSSTDPEYTPANRSYSPNASSRYSLTSPTSPGYSGYSPASPSYHTFSMNISGMEENHSESHTRSPGSDFPMSSSDASRAFQALIHLQSASGTWDITPELVGIIRGKIPSSTITVQSLQDVCAKHRVHEQVVAVLMALLFLDIHYAERRSEWQMLAMKCQFFLANMANIDNNLQAKIVEDIKQQGIKPIPTLCQQID